MNLVILQINLIKKQLGEAGIKINLKTTSSEQFASALKNGHFQLYLGEIKLNRNMDVSSLVLKGGSAAYGMPEAPKKSENKKDKENKEDEKEEEAAKPEEEEIPEDTEGGGTHIGDLLDDGEDEDKVHLILTVEESRADSV